MANGSTCSVSEDVSEKAVQSSFRVQPAMHEMVGRFLAGGDELHSLLDCFGSPLNLIFPELFHENLKNFEETFAHHGIEGFTYFASKPNKSAAILREASLSSAGLDVSSLESLRAALGSGFHPGRIEATGPKNLSYLSLALQQGVVINLDSLEELILVADLRRILSLPQPVSVFVRLCGFKSTHTTFTSQDSTFGTPVAQAADVFSLLERYRDDLFFKGFSFHLNTHSISERLVAIENLLELTLEARRRGFTPDGINIGGGYRINYAKHPEEWLRLVESLKQSLLSNEEPLTWNRSGLGYYREGNRIRGAATFMDHVAPQDPTDELCSLLSYPLKTLDGISAGRFLAESMLTLFVEPGRSILNHLGITVARVAGTKRSECGEQLVVLEMNRSNLNASELKLMTDPVHILRKSRTLKPCEKGLFYTGSLCVHNELIQYRKYFPECLPERGDAIAFVNTAPYMMDFVESATLHHPVAKKVALYASGAGFSHVLDEHYEPRPLRSLREMDESEVREVCQ
jgi:diaminopimelate decarboxylase